MRAYCRVGQWNATLGQYRRCKEIVGEELGAEPMHKTTELYQQITERRLAVEHVQSGESAAFLDPDGLLDFLRRFGLMREDESQPARKEESIRR